MLHHPPCKSLGAHILRVRDEPEAEALDVSALIPLATFEYDRETAPETIDPIDAWKRLRELSYTEAELRWSAGDR